MYGSGAVGVFRPTHFSIVLLPGLENGRDIIFHFEVSGNPSFLVKKLGFLTIYLPSAHLQ